MEEERIDTLLKRGVVPTLQRLTIFQYLEGSNSHPTADDIYQALKKQHSIFSRATVYNTLFIFKEASIIQELTIDKREVHYDPIPTPHHHFYCKVCKKIFNIDIDCPVAKKREINGHKVEDVQSTFYGVCKRCLTKSKE
jgi:Fur family peroxide stress response transcriptional regulator